MTTAATVVPANLTDEQRTKLMKACKDASDSYTRSSAESDYLTEMIKKVAEELKFPKKLVTALAKTYHKQNFEEVVAEHDAFERVYKSVVK